MTRDEVLNYLTSPDDAEVITAVQDLIHENEALTADNIRLTRLCQDLLDRLRVCHEATKDVADQTYIFRRATE